MAYNEILLPYTNNMEIPPTVQLPVYLDLGGALAAFGLIFAVYQLRKPQWDITLKIKSQWQRSLFWFFGIAGLIITLLRVIFVEFNLINNFPSPLNLVVTYEVIAYIAFVLSPASLLLFTTRSHKIFNANNAERFYNIIVWEISKNNDENTNAAIAVLFNNLDQICKLIADPHVDKETKQFACAVLDVALSDHTVVKILTTKRLNGLQMLFSTIERYDINESCIGVGISVITRNLFFDKESFLYKHTNREGLALPLNIYKTIFDSEIILKNFNLFGYQTLNYRMRGEMNSRSIDVYIEVLSKSIRTYFLSNDVPARHINDGLSYLSEVFGDLCFKIANEKDRRVDTKYIMKDEWWSLHLIANFLGHDYQFIGDRDELNSDTLKKEEAVDEIGFHSYRTINSGIAAAIYKAFEQLSYIKNDEEDIYHTVLELLGSMMDNENRKEGYRQPFEKRMWEQIGGNVLNRHYPAALRTYLVFIGFCLVSKNQRNGWIGEQAERMRKLLYIDLKPLLDKKTKMVNEKLMQDALLPSLMKYKDGKFYYTIGFGEEKSIEIEPAKESDSSALSEVDLKHSSHT